MKGQRPIRTVRQLMSYLACCPPEAVISLMPEDGDGFPIAGVLEFSSQEPQEVWILIDEFGEAEKTLDEIEWSGEGEEPPDEGVERLGDMGVIQEAPKEVPDVVRVRGKLRSA